MSKALYLNGQMYTDEFEEFDFMLIDHRLEGIEMVNCVPYMDSNDSVYFKVAVTVDDIYDYNYGYAQVLEEFGFSYEGHVGA